ncbi:MAG TPA: FTR1 family protein [Candidatus Acidoferrum sp.]|jgi:high-affinity iron transporter|nr:FTR1 family protein [Candidatus Acidoferrum sp.]
MIRTLGALRLMLAVSLVLAGGAASAAPAGPPGTSAQTILHMLDYVGVDYPGAVKDGKVLDESEFREQIDFVTQAITMLGELPDRPERAALVEQARRLRSLVQARGPAEDVTRLVGEIRGAVVKAYQVPVAPARPPDLRAARDLYAARCAACHGAEGRADGPAAKGLDPAPSNFQDRERLDRLSAYALYSTIALGVPGTSMTAFADLSDEQRWGLALHVAGLADGPSERQRGAALWERRRRPAVFPDLSALATATAAETRARHGEDGAALLAYLRSRPDLLAQTGGDALARSVRLLGESLDAYRAGRAREAQDLAVSSYLDGFELIEASLDAVDRTLRGTVETEMIRYRAMLRDGAPVPAVEAQAARLQELLGDTRRVLSETGLSGWAAFVSAFFILLREGLEAVLVVAAIIALLVRAGRRDGLPAVHGGWIAALALGALTWVVASYVVTISGATREVTEGVTALAAAAILLYVGFWMHDKSHARRWQGYVQGRLSGALSRGTTWGLAGVSFLAVYREVFETVLFYQALWLQTTPGSEHALLGGLAAAAVALAILSWLIVRGGLRLPLGVFFGLTSIVMAALAIVLAGKGIAALQEAAILAHHPIAAPSVPLIGLYPDLLSVMLQVVLAATIVAGFTWRSRAVRRES